MIPIVLIWTLCITYLFSIGTPSFVPNSYLPKMTYESYISYLAWFMLFGLFWLMAFLDGIGKY